MLNNVKKTIKIGIIGAGWVAKMRHIPALQKDGRANIIAILDHDRQKAELVSRKFKIPYVFTNEKEFLSLDIDAVVICTPPFTHYELAKNALLSRKHVLVEKPMVMTEEEGKELEILSKKMNAVLMPSHNFLFSRSILRAKNLLEKGKIGKVKEVRGIQWSSWRRQLPAWYQKLPGGLFFDESPHLIYLLRYFLGDLVVKDVWYSEKIEFDGQISQKFEIVLESNNKEGFLSMWFGAPISEWFLIVSGTLGVLILDIFRDNLYLFPKEKERTPKYLLETAFIATKYTWCGLLEWGIRRYILRQRNLFGTDRVVKNFLDAILKKDVPLITPMEGWKTVEVINKILKFAKLI